MLMQLKDPPPISYTVVFLSVSLPSGPAAFSLGIGQLVVSTSVEMLRQVVLESQDG